MSYKRAIKWEIIPKNLPVIRKYCQKCKARWNMTIYERVKPSDIDDLVFNKFLDNDTVLTRNQFVVDISCQFPLGLRTDRVLGKKLGISRKSVEKLYSNSVICGLSQKNLTREKVGNNLRLIIGSIKMEGKS